MSIWNGSGSSGTSNISAGESKGDFSYLDAGGEQDVVELSPTNTIIIQTIKFNVSALTKSGTFKLYMKVNGGGYVLVSNYYFDVDFDSDGIILNYNIGTAEGIKVTYEELTDEGAARTIPYSIVYLEIT